MKDLDCVLRRDGLSEAEKITGKSYKEDKLTSGLGLLLHMENTKEKRDMLNEMGDITFSMTVDSYLDVLKKEGFEVIYSETFLSERWEKEEVYYVLWNEKGILLDFDTFRSDINGGKLFYNVKPFEQDLRKNNNWAKVISSGKFEKVDNEFIWCGDHDCREAVVFHIKELSRWGEFVCPWVKAPFYWLCHYEDFRRLQEKEWNEKTNEYDRLTKERISKFPTHVRKSILFED